MGKTRDFINELKGEIINYKDKKQDLIRHGIDNATQHDIYKHNLAALDQKYEQKIRNMIQKHLVYLDQPDPYGRSPILDSKVKKILFTNLIAKIDKRRDIETNPSHKKTFIEIFEKEIQRIEDNPVIDQPRWAPLQFNHIFNFFKSMLYGSKNENKSSSPGHKKNK
ncbi:MAG TPA: hypothetical protein VHD33_00135 [Legionellaceae bacterium]|nr:hypothetical protein [Legionellaceae bacterium]